MILYPISKFKGREYDSLIENRAAKQAFRKLKYVMFNPIEHSYFEARYLKSKVQCPQCKSENIGWWGEKEPNNETLECIDCHHDFDEKTAIHPIVPDYIAEDLAIMKGLMKDNGMISETTFCFCAKCDHSLIWANTHHETQNCPKCGQFYYRGNYFNETEVQGQKLFHYLEKKISHEHYDTGLVCIVLESAEMTIQYCKHKLESNLPLSQDLEFIKRMNFSYGAMQEYMFCKQHHILCVPLEIALKLPFEQWDEYAL
jgi:ssDNA-binding Zn-finger/Zn-ribbon topoisomerase 1